ncbi:MAG: TolC family protein [Endomicrobium sp.]|jgi:outer membrane protein TolC|nr:TolC family protein [Endomicrobium sp.]
MKKKLLFAVFIVFAAAQIGRAEFLTLQGYVDLVLQNNADFQSVQANIDAVNGKLAAIERTYSYYLSAGAGYTVDRSQRQSFNGMTIKDLKNVSYDVSVNKQFETGTQVSVGFNGTYNSVSLLPSGDGASNDLAGPFVRLQQSLLQEFNGGSTKASLAKARADAQSALYLLKYQKQSIILKAKLAYWNLSYARTVIDFRKTSLSRTKKILDWNQRRYNLDLAEKTDLLQSQAALKLGELNLKLAYESELQARRNFNVLLNIDSANVNYEVEKFAENGAEYEKGKILEKEGVRADVLSALENVKSAQYDQEAQEKTSGADLVLAGQFSLNGVDNEFRDAADYVIHASRPSYSLSLRYTLPLDFKIRKAVNEGYEAARVSAQKAAQAASITENNDWLQLVDNWENAKSRLTLVVEIRTVQQQRHEEEQSLLKKGRSTTYMVIQSEQDLDDATLNVLQGVFELITIYEQAEAFYKNNY